MLTRRLGKAVVGGHGGGGRSATFWKRLMQERLQMGGLTRGGGYL